ncbi:CDP-glycerol glycerophosphotransferase family protein [Candidatus Saccharibacteria bacterium]|nr:CDP-glycerol glycerophosphotransferase family protein [Candidatus Saccharibacteria bacterium]
MKIDKTNPRHWLYLFRSSFYVIVSILIRPFLRSAKKKQIVLYGHKFNGNLKTLAEYILERDEYSVYFVTLDPDYYRVLQHETDLKNTRVLFLQKLSDVVTISRSSAIITDRWAPVLSFYLLFTNMPFFDVWHGIQIFKKFRHNELDKYKKYNEIWTSSESLVDVYVKDYGFLKDRVYATGYGRVDPLVDGSYHPKKLKKKYGISEKYKKVILLAPTWQQDDPTRQVIPFGENPEVFLDALNTVAANHNSLIIFRAHLNTNARNKAKMHELNNIRVMSHNDYPQGEEFLSFSDILIGDWSSIAFEFLPLHRPTIFLDVPIPFSEGLTFGIENRFGEVVKSLDELVAAIDTYIREPALYMKKHQTQIAKTERIAFGATLDGKSNERYYQRLTAYLRK